MLVCSGRWCQGRGGHLEKSQTISVPSEQLWQSLRKFYLLQKQRGFAF